MSELQEWVWNAGESGLPQDLFKPECVINITQPDGSSYQASWDFGGSEGGLCSLGPMPSLQASSVSLTTPGGSYTVDVDIQDDLFFGMWSGTLSLSDPGTGNAGQFIAQASPAGPPPPDEC